MQLLKRLLRKPHAIFSAYLFDPWDMLKRVGGLYYLVRNSIKYTKENTTNFKVSFKDIYYKSYDRFAPAGSVPSHYFLQDIWAAQYIFKNKISHLVDVGSRLDGYIAHLLAYCKVTFIDIRPLEVGVENLTFRQGSILNLPFENDSVENLSSLHVIEHIGLGRYGDTVDPIGHIRAANELIRILAPGGILLISTIVGKEQLCFDAHRIFDPLTIVSMFHRLEFIKFCLIDDEDKTVIEDATFEQGASCSYGCGIFLFKKVG